MRAPSILLYHSFVVCACAHHTFDPEHTISSLLCCECVCVCDRARELTHHTFDPEHLIVNGAGGAFLHPTHIFAPACFLPARDPAAEATAALYSAAQLPCTCRVVPYDPSNAWGAGPGGFNAGACTHAHTRTHTHTHTHAHTRTHTHTEQRTYRVVS